MEQISDIHQRKIDVILENNKHDWIKTAKEIQSAIGLSIKESGTIAMKYHDAMIKGETSLTSDIDDVICRDKTFILKGRQDRELHFRDMNIEIIKKGKTVFAGTIEKITIESLTEPNIYTFGEMRISFPKESPGFLFTDNFLSISFMDKASYDMAVLFFKQQVVDYWKRQQQLEEHLKIMKEEAKKKAYEEAKEKKQLKNIPHCPKCNSTNLQYLGEDNIGGREAKTKTTTSLNLNPLKPLTVFNHKEKVVKKGKEGINMDRWRCIGCGKVFTTLK